MTSSSEDSNGRIELQIERGGEPIRGSVQEGGRSHSFSGWLGLAAALGDLLGSKGTERASESHREES